MSKCIIPSKNSSVKEEMDPLEVLGTQIQALSGNVSDVSELNILLKQADRLLHAEFTRLLPLLNQLDPSKHSLGYLYFLEAGIAGVGQVTGEQASSLLLKIGRFISSCYADQIRLAPDKFTAVCKWFKAKVVSLGEPLRGVAPMLTAIRKLQLSTHHLTTLHPKFLFLCLLSKCFKLGLSIVEEDVIDVQHEARDFFEFCFLGGKICIGQKRFCKALELLKQVVSSSSSTNSINDDVLEAFKEYILISLIHHRHSHFSTGFRNASSVAKPYIELVRIYSNGIIADLEAYVEANKETFEADKNLGLVKLVVSSMYKQYIQKMNRTYSILSLQDIANTLQLNSTKAAEKLVLQMIEDGEIYAKISQKDGMVVFFKKPEQYKSYETIESIQRMSLVLKYDELARRLVLRRGSKLMKYTKGGKRQDPHEVEEVRMDETRGVLKWGTKSKRRNVVCREVLLGPSPSFVENRLKKKAAIEPGLFRIVTTPDNKEYHFVCEDDEIAELWVRGIKLVTREAICSETQKQI